MKKKAIKITLIIIASVIALIILLTATLLITGTIEIGFDNNGNFQIVINADPGVMDTYDQTIQATLTTYPTDIFVYGEDCKFRKNVKFTQIDGLSEENLKSGKKYKVIIFNDLYDKMELSENDISILKKYVLEGDYAFFYTGNKHIDLFYENGFIKGELREGSIGFSIRHSGETIIASSGLWDEQSLEYYETNNPEILGESIFIFIKRVLREG